MRSLLVGAVLIACTCASQSAQASPLAAHLSPACEASAPGTLLVSWQGDAEFRLYYVSIALDDGTAAIALETTTATALNFTGLARSTNFQVAVRGLPKASPTLAWGPSWLTSSAVRCSTSNKVLAEPPSTSVVAPGDNIDGTLIESSASSSSFLRVFRVSEYSFDVDFLKNHDAASITAMPLCESC